MSKFAKNTIAIIIFFIALSLYAQSENKEPEKQELPVSENKLPEKANQLMSQADNTINTEKTAITIIEEAKNNLKDIRQRLTEAKNDSENYAKPHFSLLDAEVLINNLEEYITDMEKESENFLSYVLFANELKVKFNEINKSKDDQKPEEIKIILAGIEKDEDKILQNTKIVNEINTKIIELNNSFLAEYDIINTIITNTSSYIDGEKAAARQAEQLKFLFELISLSALGLGLISIFVFILINIRKNNKIKLLNITFKNEIENINKEILYLKEMIDNKPQEIITDGNTLEQDEIKRKNSENEEKILKLESLISEHSRLINELILVTSGERAVQGAIRDGDNNPVSLFNIWASNPKSALPSSFYYVSGEPKLRTTQILNETSNETAWIKNRIGEKIFLFPNPNTFEQMTDITGIYKMELEFLKPKGQNRIKVIEACEVYENDFISYPGKLDII